MRLLRYLLGNARFPQSGRLGFHKMGLGIERRRGALAEHWDPHLTKCRSQQTSWCTEHSSEKQASVHVLGAGRLYDVDLDSLAKKFAEIVLVDGDPLCRASWRKAAKRISGIHGEVIELSGCIDDWRSELREAIPFDSWEDAIRHIEKIPPRTLEDMPPGKFLELPKTQACISLNLLSQIPLLWQDIVEDALQTAFSISRVSRQEEEWLQAFSRGARLLVEQHLRDLGTAGYDSILLLSDLEYMTYFDANHTGGARTNAPLQWIDEDSGGHWVESESNARANSSQPLYCESQNALYGVDLESLDTRNRFFPNYEAKQLQTWVWHIEPIGTEYKKKGKLHRVSAFSFTRRKDSTV